MSEVQEIPREEGKTQIGHGFETRFQQVQTIFDSYLYAAAARKLNDPESLKYLGQIEETTGLTNQTLLSRAALDLTVPDGTVVVEVVDLGKDKPIATSEIASFSIQTPEGVIESDKPLSVILLNESSGEFRLKKRFPFNPFKKPHSDILSFDSKHAGIGLLQAIVTNQVRLETEPGKYMPRSEYFALQDQAGR